MSSVTSPDSSTLPRGSAFTERLAWFTQSVRIVAVQEVMFVVRVTGRPDCRRRLAPVVMSYGNRYEPLNLKMCRRPPLSPDALTNALFGFDRLVCSTLVCE